jgi:small GTP-binding protein
MNKCPFCSDLRDKTIYETDKTMAVLSATCVRKGHTLIIPKRHVQSICELGKDEQRDFFETLSLVREKLSNLGVSEILVYSKDGPSKNKTVDHAHFHLIPNYEDDPLPPTYPLDAKSGFERGKLDNKLIAELKRAEVKPKINLVIVGHVDHGKSTLIGRLLHDTGSLSEGKIEEIRQICHELGRKFEYSFILDHLQEEREQAVTIDTTQMFFSRGRRDYVIIDVPGHKEFLKNMVTGASNADAILMLVSAKGDEGIQEQTKRHLFLTKFLGIENVIVAVNKMDTVGYSKDRYDQIVTGMKKVVDSLGYDSRNIVFIPLSAAEGENITMASERMPWYNGKPLVEALDENISPPESLVDKPLRMPVQDVYELEGVKIIVGKVETGVLKLNDELVFQPSGFLARAKEIKSSSQEKREAGPGESIGIVTDKFDENEVKRGYLCGRSDDSPNVTEGFIGQIFLLGDQNIVEGDDLGIRWGAAECNLVIRQIKQIIDSETGREISKRSGVLKPNDSGVISAKFEFPSAIEEFSKIPPLGRFVLIKNKKVSAAGTVLGFK